MLSQQILKGIEDDQPVIPLVCLRSPLSDLLDGYRKEPEAAAYPIGAETTGAEFKAALDRLNPEVLVTLLSKYSIATKSLLTPTVYAEDPEKTENRRLRHWLVKFGAITFTSIAFIVVGASMAIAYKAGVVDNALVQTAMAAATEIFKLVFTTVH
jgi:hypothetical protein